ncbi:MAG: hypothetical protein HOO96_38615 [Polyangiaceae bacterium]|nr:hypothetical protein [Polyangiaceae bacterium]
MNTGRVVGLGAVLAVGVWYLASRPPSETRTPSSETSLAAPAQQAEPEPVPREIPRRPPASPVAPPRPQIVIRSTVVTNPGVGNPSPGAPPVYQVAPQAAAAPPPVYYYGPTGTPAPLNMGGPVHVNGYVRKDGTYVRPHTRSR